MNFNVDGYLGAGLHDLMHSEIEEHFVSGFPTSTTRKQIFLGYSKHKDEISELSLGCTEFLNGSL